MWRVAARVAPASKQSAPARTHHEVVGMAASVFTECDAGGEEKTCAGKAHTSSKNDSSVATLEGLGA